ncbi:unnamed protein product, partial [Symbiodinium necroappetens]
RSMDGRLVLVRGPGQRMVSCTANTSCQRYEASAEGRVGKKLPRRCGGGQHHSYPPRHGECQGQHGHDGGADLRCANFGARVCVPLRRNGLPHGFLRCHGRQLPAA